MKRILTVCLGNICRSPIAHGLLEGIAQARNIDVSIDSAGTAGYHIGQAPDLRSQAVMKAHGYDISEQRGRQFTAADFDRYDFILAMDKHNARDMLRLAPSDAAKQKVRLILSFGQHELNEVPDPYYGGDDGFDKVFAMIYTAVEALYDKEF